MKFVIITHVPHISEQDNYFAYAPYVREMNVWSKFANKIIIVAPVSLVNKTEIDLAYQHHNIKFIATESFHLLTLISILTTLVKIPKIIWQVYSAMQQANHIHLRCPGNMGLLGAIVQIAFPKKIKTAKYAGNWDPKAKNPISYRLQKWILSNTFLTRNMQVLVYGEWENQTKNIKPFFTATYLESDKKAIHIKNLNGVIKIIFVGTLTLGKRPLYAIQLIEKLFKNNLNVQLSIYGEGQERKTLENYIETNNLQNYIFLIGNQNAETIKKAYQESHFVILPSESEGWPKVVAEGMFWGCVPISTAVSCVPYLLGYGKRGLLLDINLENDSEKLVKLLLDKTCYQKMVNNGVMWSRKYTLDYFEQEIKLLLQI